MNPRPTVFRTRRPAAFTAFVVGRNSTPTETYSMILGPGGDNADNRLRWENGTRTLVWETAARRSDGAGDRGDRRPGQARTGRR